LRLASFASLDVRDAIAFTLKRQLHAAGIRFGGNMANGKPFIEGVLNPSLETVAVQNEKARLSPFDVVVMAALINSFADNANQEVSFFPVKLDSGYSGNFHISQDQLRSKSWAAFEDSDIIPNGQSVLTRYANNEQETLALYYGEIWLLGTARNEICRIELDRGYSIYGDAPKANRPKAVVLHEKVPLLGQRALTSIGAKLHIDYSTGRFKLWVPKEHRETL